MSRISDLPYAAATAAVPSSLASSMTSTSIGSYACRNTESRARTMVRSALNAGITTVTNGQDIRAFQQVAPPDGLSESLGVQKSGGEFGISARRGPRLQCPPGTLTSG